MNCQRCHFDFCWCCMGNYRTHNRWFALCPNLPFSICVNIILVLLAMIFMPVIFTLGPLGAAFYYYFDFSIKCAKCFLCCRRSRYQRDWKYCLNIMLWLILGLLIILPINLTLAALASGLLLALATIPGLYYGIAYIIRVIYNVASA